MSCSDSQRDCPDLPESNDLDGIAKMVEAAKLDAVKRNQLIKALLGEFGRVFTGLPFERVAPVVAEISRQALRLPPRKLLKQCYSFWRYACSSGGQNEMSAVFEVAFAICSFTKIEDVISVMVDSSRALTRPVEVDGGRMSFAGFVADLLSQVLDTQDMVSKQELSVARTKLRALSSDPILGEAASEIIELIAREAG